MSLFLSTVELTLPRCSAVSAHASLLVSSAPSTTTAGSQPDAFYSYRTYVNDVLAKLRPSDFAKGRITKGALLKVRFSRAGPCAVLVCALPRC